MPELIQEQILTPEQEQEKIKQEEEYNSIFKFDLARERIDALISSWSTEKEKTKTRRNIRHVEVDVDSLRRTGVLKDDETFIPIRVVDSTIEKEKPPFIAFLKQSRRTAVMKCRSNPSIKTDLIEQEFTDKMRYTGWECAYYECLDGAQTHAWASIEVELDLSKPGGVNIDYIEHDKLLFWLDLESHQMSDIILREYEVTKEKLQYDFVLNFGFNKKIVDELIEKSFGADGGKKSDCNTITIYKKMCRYNGQIYVIWYSKDATDWLKEPQLLWRGKWKKVQKMVVKDSVLPGYDGIPNVIQMPQIEEVWEKEYETKYPYHLLPYAKTEEKKISKLKGRCFKDGPKQEAQCALWSSFINGVVRASNVYASPSTAQSTGRPAIMDLILEHGKVYSEPMSFWAPPYPSPQLLTASSALETQHQAETGLIAFAAVNRQDSRKTAKEISSAEQQNALLNSVEVTLFSAWVREVTSDSWTIVQSLALHGDIEFLRTQVVNVNALGMEEVSWNNDIEIIGETYEIFAAGEIDVIQRQEKLMARQQLWPVISQTSLAMTFLVDIIKETLPEDAERYSQILMQGDITKQTITALQTVVNEIAKNPQDAVKYKQQFGQLAQQLNMVQQTQGQENAAT